MLKKQKPNKPIAARTINQLVDAAEQFGQISAAGGMVGQGYRLTVTDDATFPAKLSGTTSPYSWVEVYGAPGGGWTTLAGGRTGTANAYEYNAKGSLTGKVVILKPHGPGAYKFTLNRKPTGSGTIYIPVTGCSCSALPSIIHMSASGECTTRPGMCSFGGFNYNGTYPPASVFINATLTYQTTPTGYESFAPPSGSGWFSEEHTTTFWDFNNVAPYDCITRVGPPWRYILKCELGYIKIYQTNISTGPVLQFAIGSAVTCTPLLGSLSFSKNCRKECYSCEAADSSLYTATVTVTISE